jgi:chromosome segregation ATPase
MEKEKLALTSEYDAKIQDLLATAGKVQRVQSAQYEKKIQELTRDLVAANTTVASLEAHVAVATSSIKAASEGCTNRDQALLQCKRDLTTCQCNLPACHAELSKAQAELTLCKAEHKKAVSALRQSQDELISSESTCGSLTKQVRCCSNVVVVFLL